MMPRACRWALPLSVGVLAAAVPAHAASEGTVSGSDQSCIPAFDAAPAEGRLSRVVEPRTFRIGARYNF